MIEPFDRRPVDFSAVTTGMVSAALREPLTMAPVPHLFIRDWVSGPLRAALLESLPNPSRFTSIEGGGLILRSDAFLGHVWSLYDAVVRHMLSLLLPRFSAWWESDVARVDAELGAAWATAYYPSFIGVADPTRGVRPHADGETAILTAVSVLGYPDGSPAPVTNFFPPDASPSPLTRYPPSSGSLFVMPNHGRQATHGVIEPILPWRITHMASITGTRVAAP